MKVFIAGSQSRINLVKKYRPLFILESFYKIDENCIPEFKKAEMFLLDSGAFTFMNNFKGNVDWMEYIDKYADFIIKNDIRYFFELDIDSIVGYEKVKDYTKYLENKTNRRCIPVWHKSRGLKEWKRLTSEYDYVAIGGIVTKEIKPQEYDIFCPLLNIARINNCKVHGLGFTSTSKLTKYHFYSVDSTSWLKAYKFGRIDYFDGKKMKTYPKPKNSRLCDCESCNDLVLKEWVKFQKYAEIHL